MAFFQACWKVLKEDIMNAFRDFHARLNINLAKSELGPVGNVHNVEDMARILGCMMSSLPMKYLSLPLGAFYFLISNVVYIKSAKGATLVHKEYTRECLIKKRKE
jgi:hypothetical protein